MGEEGANQGQEKKEKVNVNRQSRWQVI